MSETFGARLRHHRERRRISLETIAEQTKIKGSLLDGLERDDLSQWPSGIFRRAYVRAYAVAIGLDADAIVREFLALHPDPDEILPPPAPEPTRIRRLLDAAFGSLLRRGPANGPEPENAQAPPAPRQTDATVPASAVTSPAKPTPAARPSEPAPDLLAAAALCTALGRVKSSSELAPLLRDAAKLLSARGLIVWTWDAAAGKLRPAMIHGYSEKVRARLRPVKPDADNATAEAFRLAETRAFAGHDSGRSALAIPLLSAAGCAGVLAIELSHERAELPAVQAIATFIAAVLAQLIGGPDNGEREAGSGPSASSEPARASSRAGERETGSGGRGAEQGARNEARTA